MKKLWVLGFVLLFFIYEAKAFLKVKEIEGSSGVKAWFVYDPTSPIISMSFSFQGGSSADPKGKEGTGDLLSSVLLQGAGGMDKPALTAKMQNSAIKIRFDNGLDFFSGSLQTPQSNREEAFKLLGSILTQPNFSSNAIERSRSLLMTYLANIKKNPRALANRTLKAALFPEHEYSRPTYGDETSVRSLARPDLQNYLKKNLVRSRLIVGITGKLTEAEAKQLLDRAFGHLPKGEMPSLVKDVAPKSWSHSKVVEQDIPQSTVMIAQPGWRFGHKDFLAADFLMYILGGGLSSRLMEEIRTKRGYAYTVASRMNPLVHSGLIMASLGASHEYVEEAIELLKQEWVRLKEHGITQKEFEDTKRSLINSFALRFQSSASVAHYLRVYQIYKFPKDYFQKRRQILESLSLQELNTLAKTLLKPEELSIVVVGRPLDENKESTVRQAE